MFSHSGEGPNSDPDLPGLRRGILSCSHVRENMDSVGERDAFSHCNVGPNSPESGYGVGILNNQAVCISAEWISVVVAGFGEIPKRRSCRKPTFSHKTLSTNTQAVYGRE